jgi:hypothetical protein
VIEENKSLRSRNCFLETHYVYNEQVPPEHEASLQEFLINGMKRSKITSLIYHVSRYIGEGIGYSHFKNRSHPLQSACLRKTSSESQSVFVKGRSVHLDVSETDKTSEPQE